MRATIAIPSGVVLTVLLVPFVDARVPVPARAVTPQASTSGPKQHPKDSRPFERRSPSVVRVPYPGSIKPAEILANLQVHARETTLGELPGYEALLRPDTRVARVLDVRSDNFPPGYLVVDVADGSGRLVALFAISRGGTMIAAKSLRDEPQPPRPMDLADAAMRVRGRRGKVPQRMEYVYAASRAEPGIAYFWPLAVVHTERGPVYFNSKGEAYAEESSPLLDEFPPKDLPASVPEEPGRRRVLNLRLLGSW